MSKKNTIADIAKLANVAPCTVSRAFQNDGKVNPKTRETIIRIADSLDYHPRKYTSRSHSMFDTVVGIIVADLQNSFFLDIIRGITDVLNDNGINVVVCDSRESVNKEIINLNTQKQYVSGIIISPVSSSVDYNAEFLANIEKSGTPVILVDRDISMISLDGVFQNSYSGAYHAIETLIKNGHKNIAIVSGPISSKPGLDRLNGYMDSLKHHNIPVKPNYILYGDFMEESGYTLTKRLLKNEPDVTAVFCTNNLMATGALRAISEAHLKIPDDISVFSYGTVDILAADTNFGISAMELPSRIMGEECGKMMLERLKGRKERKTHIPKRITFDARMILKGSEIMGKNRIE